MKEYLLKPLDRKILILMARDLGIEGSRKLSKAVLMSKLMENTYKKLKIALSKYNPKETEVV